MKRAHLVTIVLLAVVTLFVFYGTALAGTTIQIGSNFPSVFLSSVSCTGSKPELSLSKGNIFWASYADYTARELTVQTLIRNTGSETAYGVSITGATSINGATLSSQMPFNLGDLVSGASAEFGARYNVPVGVGLFITKVMGSATDACGTSYTYPTSNTSDTAASIAMNYLGVPYVWGGASPSGFDDSGLVMYVYSQLGISLPHSAVGQFLAGIPISYSELAPGDLVFFGSGFGHVGIYIGGGSMIHAPFEGDIVQIAPVFSGGTYFGACRI